MTNNMLPTLEESDNTPALHDLARAEAPMMRFSCGTHSH